MYTIKQFEDEIGAMMAKAPQAGHKLVSESIERIEPLIQKETPRSNIPMENRRYRGIRKRRGVYKTRRSGTWDEYNKLPLVEDIKKTHVSGMKDLRPRRAIGYGKESGWRVHFPNYGVVAYKRYPKPQYFIESVRRKSIPVVDDLAAELLKEVFG